jgi:colicin import membrane protein
MTTTPQEPNTMDDTQVLDAAPKAEAKSAVAEYSRVEAGLADYRQRYHAVVYDLTTTAGDKAARAARLEIKTTRTTLERLRKEAKAPHIAACNLLDAEAQRITAELLKLEEPIDAQIKADEARREREKAEREQRERERIGEIRARIADIVALPVALVGASSDKIAAAGVELRSMSIEADAFGEFVDEARGARLQVAAKVEQMLDAVRAAEAEQVRLAAERAELQRQREELEARQRADAERQAAEQARVRAEQEAEAARLAAEREALERQRAADEAAERQRRAEAEQRAAELRAQEDAFRAEQEAARQKAHDEEQARLQRQQQAAESLNTNTTARIVNPVDGLAWNQEVAGSNPAAQTNSDDGVSSASTQVPTDSVPSFESILADVQDEEPAPTARPSELALALAVAEKFAVSPNEAIDWLGAFSPTIAEEELKLLAKEIQ